MLKKFCAFACALTLFAGAASQSFAANIGSVIATDNSLTRLSDNSLEVLWNAGFAPGAGDTTVDVGDRLIAIGRIDQVSSPFPTPDKLFGTAYNEEFTFASVIQVSSVTPPAGPGGTFSYTFAPSAVNDPLGLGWSNGTMIAFYSDPANNYISNPVSINDGITRASGGTKWWEFGMNGGLPGETWTATTVTNDISALASAPPGVSGGSFSFVLDLLKRNAGLELSPVVGDLELSGSGILLGPPPSGGWQTNDNYDAFIRAVPEPGSMAVFGLLGVAGLARRFRRK